MFCNPAPHWRVSTAPCQFKNNQTADLLLSSIVFSGLFTHLRSNIDYQLFLNEVYANLPIYFYALRMHGETRDSPKKRAETSGYRNCLVWIVDFFISKAYIHIFSDKWLNLVRIIPVTTQRVKHLIGIVERHENIIKIFLLMNLKYNYHKFSFDKRLIF